MVGISSSFVCRGQYWLVYHPVLFVMDNIGWYISQFCLSLTILADISPVFVCRGQYWVVYFTVVSVVDSIGGQRHVILSPIDAHYKWPQNKIYSHVS